MNSIFKILPLFSVLIFLMGMGSSCEGNKKSPQALTSEKEDSNTKVKIDLITKSKSIKYIGDSISIDGKDCYAQNDISLIWINEIGGNDIKTLQDSILSSTFGNGETDVKKSIDKYLSSSDYENIQKTEEVNEVPKDAAPLHLSTTTISTQLKALNDNYLVYHITNYHYYAGAAHGLQVDRYLNYSLKYNDVLSFDKVFLPNVKDKIMEPIKQSLFSKYEVSNLKELGDKGINIEDLFVSHNFYLNSWGITFVYSPYEIGCYAMGTIEVTVPITDLKYYLTSQVKEIYGSMLID